MYNMQTHTGVCVSERAHLRLCSCIAIMFVSVDKTRHTALFIRVISCMWLYVYVPDRAHLHPPFTAIQIIYSPPGLQRGFWPAALLVAQPSPGFPPPSLAF